MYKLFVFVPSDFKEKVKAALFDAGAGKLGNYSHCCFETKGQGQFMANDEAKPFIGNANELEVVEEFKLELLVEPKAMVRVLEALVLAHPYEEPAYEVIELVDPKTFFSI